MNNNEKKNVTMQQLTSEELEFVSGGGPLGWLKEKASDGAKAAGKYVVKKAYEAYDSYKYIRRWWV